MFAHPYRCEEPEPRSRYVEITTRPRTSLKARRTVANRIRTGSGGTVGSCWTNWFGTSKKAHVDAPPRKNANTALVVQRGTKSKILAFLGDAVAFLEVF